MKKLILLLIMASVQLSAQDLKQSGLDKINKQEWAAAAEDFNQYLKNNESDSSVWYNLANAYVNLEQYKKAVASFEKAKETNFNKNLIAYGMSKTYALMKNEIKMLETLREGAKNGLANYAHLNKDKLFEPFHQSIEFQQILEEIKRNAYPCLSDENYRHFDFWLGDWDVLVKGKKVGENRITMAQGGCAIHEDYTTEGNYAGQSINYYDPIGEKWHQHWVGSSGDVYNYLETKSEEGFLQFESDFMGQNGEITRSRLTFTQNEDGTVRQFFENSSDGGKTWSPGFDGLYKEMAQK